MEDPRRAYPQRINERTFDFALRVVRMVLAIENDRTKKDYNSSRLLNQLLRSATSIGANRDSGILDKERTNDLFDEAEQILKILNSIVTTTNKR